MMNVSQIFYAELKLVISGRLLPDKLAHKTTWVSLNHFTENQIDHKGISQKFRRTLLDVQVKIGADERSDRHLLVRKVRLKLKRCKMPQNPRITVQCTLPHEQRNSTPIDFSLCKIST